MPDDVAEPRLFIRSFLTGAESSVALRKSCNI